jgi:2-polyprenyl-6-methoxyphenol hydroxylase-like FAD-dependent oxidoreductase
VEVFSGVGVDGLRTEDGGAAAQLTLSDGRIVTAKLVVGADGGKSRVRELAGKRIPLPSFSFQRAVEGGRAWPPHRPREGGLAHPADTSRSNLAFV